jgi:hypothetical protein
MGISKNQKKSSLKSRKLSLNRETLRILSNPELANVQGGQVNQPDSKGGGGFVPPSDPLPTWITTVSETWSALCGPKPGCN